jgi:hypothetical protein
MPLPKKITLKDINFRELVKACANDSEIVEEFNQTHECNLKCPIAALVEPGFPLNMDSEEMTQVAWFVAWIRHNHWERRQAAAANVDKLKRFYNVKLAKRDH